MVVRKLNSLKKIWYKYRIKDLTDEIKLQEAQLESKRKELAERKWEIENE